AVGAAAAAGVATPPSGSPVSVAVAPLRWSDDRLPIAVVAQLADLDVLIVDCQSTGATPAHGALLEMGWTRTRASGDAAPVRAQRVTLPEGTRIPRVVAELTGITSVTREDSVSPEEVWRNIRGAADEIGRGAGSDGHGAAVPTVIHFARFELAF